MLEHQKIKSFTLIEVVVTLILFSLLMVSFYWVIVIGDKYFHVFDNLTKNEINTITEYNKLKRNLLTYNYSQNEKIMHELNTSEVTATFPIKNLNHEKNHITFSTFYMEKEIEYVFELNYDESFSINEEIFGQ